MKRTLLAATFLTLLSLSSFAQYNGDFTATRAEVDFSRILRDWDGFGFNYVEVPQTVDYSSDPQEYGGLSLLTEQERQQVIDLVFGDDGLKPGILGKERSARSK